VYDPAAEPTGPELWIGVYAFAFQIYCDFSGYSDVARGSARLLGFELMKNFDLPYFATSLRELWRRWHISLSTWLRDYLYIPLGGSKRGGLFTYRNLIITMLLGGLWHGASWTFVVWGALHGFGLAATRVFQRLAETGTSLVRVVIACALFAAVGVGLHLTLLVGLDPWSDLVAAWIYLVPLWAALTVALSTEPAPLAGTGRAVPRYVLELRIAAGVAVIALLGALQLGRTSLWLPLLFAAPILAGLADLAELGVDRAVLRRLAVSGLRRTIAVILVFHYVCLAWVFFRATSPDGSLDPALAMLQRIASWELDAPNLIPVVMVAVGAGFVAHFFPDRSFAWLRARFVALGPIEQGALLALATVVLRELSNPTIVPFIYFQF
jgi:D-alanyl-lipoteichoic acid acyltransferase DltB (MBOAT superfamily)